MAIYPKLITDALNIVRYPGSDKSIVELGMVEDNIRIDGNKVSFSILFSRNPDPFYKSVIKAAENAIKVKAGNNIEVIITPIFTANAPKEPEKLLANVKNIIAVSSGKGGVGKSTVAANLAVALANLGFKVGLLDADIYGPSIPTMFHLEDFEPYAEVIDDKQLLIPAEKFGVKIISIGFFVNAESATVWRGPMASNALKQLISETNWGDLDYFIIDTPPGTSDIHLTLLQTLSVTGAIIVSTPQKVALADAKKGIDMYQNEKVNVPILGLVENMSWFTPAELPENKYYLFGKEGVKELAAQMHVPLLGQIPLIQSICESSDQGEPIASDINSLTGKTFRELAEAINIETEKRNKEFPPTEAIKVTK